MIHRKEIHHGQCAGGNPGKKCADEAFFSARFGSCGHELALSCNDESVLGKQLSSRENKYSLIRAFEKML